MVGLPVVGYVRTRPVRPTAEWVVPKERTAMAFDRTAGQPSPGLQSIARAGPTLDLLPASETLSGTTLEGQQRRSRTDIRTAAEAARRQHRTDAGRNQFFGRARARAARIMIGNWPAMTAVAEALLEHGTLDGHEVDRLMQAATRRRNNRPGRRSGESSSA